MKQFEALFKLTSKYLGGPGFAAATRDIDKVTKRAKTANMGMRNVHASIGKVATAIGGVALAYKVAAEASEFWKEGIAASKDARDVQEKLGVAAERNAERYKTSGAEIVKSLNGVTDKVAAVGFDSEDAQTGVTKLLESMSPKEIEAFGQAYGDITAKLKGATPGAEGFAEVSEQINTAILKGKAPWLSQIGLTDKQIKAFKKMEPAQRRAFLQQEAQNKLQGEAGRVFETTAGKVAKSAKAYEDLQQAVTKGVVGKEGQLAETYERAFKGLLPAAEKIGVQLGEAAGHWADLLEQNAEGIGRTAESIIATISRIPDTAIWVKAQLDKIPVLYDLPKNWPTLKAQWEQSIADTKAQIATLVEQWNTSVADTQKQAGTLSQQWTTSVADTSRQAGEIGAALSSQWATSIADTQRQLGEISTVVSNAFAGLPSAITSALSGVYSAIVGPFQDAYSYISGLFAGLATAIGNAAAAAASAASTASTAVSTARAAAVAGTPVPRGSLGGPGESSAFEAQSFSYSTPEPHQLGGIIGHPQIARLAERGAEAVIPLTQHRERAQSLLNYAQRAIGGAGSLRGLAAGAGRTAAGQQAGPISFNPSFAITVNAGPGQEAKTLARSVRKAMNDEVNAFLHTMKQARMADSRLGYT